jgi:hypothetical protein
MSTIADSMLDGVHVTEHTSYSARSRVNGTARVEALQIGVRSHQERLRRRLARRIASWAGLLLAGYWVVAFTLTHLPMRGAGGPMFGIRHADKLAHLLIYAGLSGLLSIWFGVRRRMDGAVAVAVIVLLALSSYATFDELSQIPVGRNADLRDWFADLAGINLGLCGFFALRAWVRR